MKNIIKKIEYKLKEIVNKIIAEDRKTYRLTTIDNAFYFGISPKILILRHDRIGDLIISTSFIRILKAHFPNWNIDILLSRYNISAKSCVEKYVSGIFVLEKSFIKYISLLKCLKRAKYDLIIDLFDNPSTTSAVIIKYSNPQFALGIDKSNSKIYDFVVPMLDRNSTNIVERICNLLIAFGINPQDNNLLLEYPVESNKIQNMIGINLSGSDINKYWGFDNNSALIEYLLAKNAVVRVFSIDKTLEYAIKLKAKYPQIIIDKCNSFDEFANEVKRCSLIISPDTSIVHLCSCFNIPIIILYPKPGNHIPWFPYNTKHIAIISESNNLLDISFEKVRLELEKMFL